GGEVQGKGGGGHQKEQEGRIGIESGTSSTTVLIRVEVPITPFAHGCLAGAFTPRQLASKARDNPREAAAFFESGMVQAWYAANGWTYPVQAPAAGGLAGVQQYFEALGLTSPPKIILNERRFDLIGTPRGSREHFLFVGTAAG